MESAAPESLAPALASVGLDEADQGRLLRTFNGWAPPFRAASTVRLPDPRRRTT